jgi:hypothetical protein
VGLDRWWEEEVEQEGDGGEGGQEVEQAVGGGVAGVVLGGEMGYEGFLFCFRVSFLLVDWLG